VAAIVGEGYFMIYLVSYLVGWLLGVLYYLANPANGFAHAALLMHLFFTVGFFGFFNFVGHSLLSEKVAARIGWVSNGFQKELGYASLGIGICGVLCIVFQDGFWLATIIPLFTFLIGAAALHVTEIIRSKNRNPGNTWIILPDVLIPVTLIVLWFLR
jgi:Family of unknown function (DUF6790)